MSMGGKMDAKTGPRTGGDFWSRRKAAVREAEAKEATAAEEALAGPAAEQQAGAEEKTEEQILEELGLADPDTMEEGDDFSAFLAGAVPQNLRRRALRRLWALNPALANLDGLVEYGEDYTDAATVVENLETTYRVGKGMLEHVMKLAEAEDETGQTDPEDGDPEQAVTPESGAEEGKIAGKETENDLLTGSNLPLHIESGENFASTEENAEIELEEDLRAATGETEDAERAIPRRRMRFTCS